MKSFKDKVCHGVVDVVRIVPVLCHVSHFILQVFDVCSEEPLPDCDIMIAADVLYNEHLASHVGKRCLEAIQRGVKMLVTDSQRFTDLLPELNRRLDVTSQLAWDERKLDAFTGSGVMVDEDQTYNVTVRVLAVGW